MPKHGSGLLLRAIRWMSKWKAGEMIVVWPLHEKKNYRDSIEVGSNFHGCVGGGFFLFVCVLVVYKPTWCIPPPAALECVHTQACSVTGT